MGYQILGVVMKDEKHARYHIKLNSGFALKKGYSTSTSTSGLTSVSLNQTLADLLALKLKTKPGSKEARAEVTKQLQEFINHDLNRGSHGLSRYLTEQAILFVIDNELSGEYNKFLYPHDEV